MEIVWDKNHLIRLHIVHFDSGVLIPSVSHPILVNPLFRYYCRGKKIGPPRMNGEKVGSFGDKISLTGYKWSNLTTRATQTHVFHPLLAEDLG